MTTSWLTWKLYISSWKSLVRSDCPTAIVSSTYGLTDSFFDNVCELDLVFNFYKVAAIHSVLLLGTDPPTSQVYAILDEIFLAGEIEETSKDVVLARLEELEKLE